MRRRAFIHADFVIGAAAAGWVLTEGRLPCREDQLTYFALPAALLFCTPISALPRPRGDLGLVKRAGGSSSHQPGGSGGSNQRPSYVPDLNHPPPSPSGSSDSGRGGYGHVLDLNHLPSPPSSPAQQPSQGSQQPVHPAAPQAYAPPRPAHTSPSDANANSHQYRHRHGEGSSGPDHRLHAGEQQQQDQQQGPPPSSPKQAPPAWLMKTRPGRKFGPLTKEQHARQEAKIAAWMEQGRPSTVPGRPPAPGSRRSRERLAEPARIEKGLGPYSRNIGKKPKGR